MDSGDKALTVDEKQFLEALAKYAPEIQKAFIDAVRNITDNVILSQVVEALERGDTEAAWRAIGFQQAAFNGLIAQIATTFEFGGVMMMASLPKFVIDIATGLRVPQRFNIRDMAAEQWLRRRSGELITGIEEDARAAVREAAAAGLEAGQNPRKTALDIVGRIDPQTGSRTGGLIGLNAQQRRWARSAREYLLQAHQPSVTFIDPETGERKTISPAEKYLSMELRDKRFDNTVRAALETGKALPIGTVDRLVDRYKDIALQYRGETIGRTETLGSLARSEYESVIQALARSGLPREAATKAWDSAGDKRVRPDHVDLDGQVRRLDEPFVVPDTGVRMMHPGDMSLGAGGKDVIACRCRVRYKIDFAYGVE